MLNCIVSSLERGASKEPLFEFTPEFYMEAAINAFHGLRHYFHPTTSFDDIPGTIYCLLECLSLPLYCWKRVLLVVIILCSRTGESFLISKRLCVEKTSYYDNYKIYTNWLRKFKEFKKLSHRRTFLLYVGTIKRDISFQTLQICRVAKAIMSLYNLCKTSSFYTRIDSL